MRTEQEQIKDLKIMSGLGIMATVGGLAVSSLGIVEGLLSIIFAVSIAIMWIIYKK